MLKKQNVLILAAMIAALLFSACSTGSGNNLNTTNKASSTSAPTQSTKTVLGILKLEGTTLAVTVDQATNLAFLYKAAKTMSASSSSSAYEISALYTQIDESLTPAQTQAITNMDITNASMITIMSELGIQSASASGTKTRPSNSSSSASAPGGFSGNGITDTGATGSGVTVTRSAPVGSSATGQTQTSQVLLTAVIDLLNKRAGLTTATPTSQAPVLQNTQTPTPYFANNVTSTPTGQ